MHGVGSDATAERVEVGELGEAAQIGVLVEFLDRLDLAGVAAVVQPLEVPGIALRSDGRIVLPGNTNLSQLLEDGKLSVGVGTVGSIVGSVSERRSRDDVGSVGVG